VPFGSSIYIANGKTAEKIVTLDVNSKNIEFISWSPSSSEFLIRDRLSNILYIVGSKTGKVGASFPGSNTLSFDAAWQPGIKTSGPVDISSLLAEKQAAIKGLQKADYRFFNGLVLDSIDAYPEQDAQELVNRFINSGSLAASPDQAEAFQRLVWYEQTLGKTLQAYNKVAVDYTEVESDRFMIIAAFYFLGIKAGLNAPAAIKDLVIKSVEDYIKLWLNNIEDEQLC
jgi:hypothetical protein